MRKISLGRQRNLWEENITVRIAGEPTKSVEGIRPQLSELKDSHELFVGKLNTGSLQLFKGRIDESGPGDFEQDAAFLLQIAAVGGNAAVKELSGGFHQRIGDSAPGGESENGRTLKLALPDVAAPAGDFNDL